MIRFHFPVVLLVCAVGASACSKSPTVTLSATDHAEYPRPDSLASLLEGGLHMGILTCYRESGSEAAGTTVVNVQGSHGILDLTVTSPSGDATLDRCTTETIGGARMAREIGDTDHFIGFGLSASYAMD